MKGGLAERERSLFKVLVASYDSIWDNNICNIGARCKSWLGDKKDGFFGHSVVNRPFIRQ